MGEPAGPAAPDAGTGAVRRPDLRALPLAGACWAGALVALLLPPWAGVATLAVGMLVVLVGRRRGRAGVLAMACLAAAAAVGCSALLRAEANQNGPVGQLAREHAVVRAEVRIATDPVLRAGEYGSYVVVRATALRVTGRGRTSTTHVPLLVIAEEPWQDVELGAVLHADGRLEPPDGADLAGVLYAYRPPVELLPPGGLLTAAARVRAAIRAAVSGRPAAERALVPALVVGDDADMPEQVAADFRTAGLTHLLAVSGTNLTLVVGFLLVLARWAGVRSRGLVVVGALGVLGFVLLARTEPSVVRAAAMGSVALLGMGTGGREKGVRALGVAVLVLLLFDPWLALALGFALSALATAGILFLAPPWRDAMARWLPRWVAEAIAVPLAAQLACTPMVAAISGQVSLVAVAANILVAPAVGPATVCGLAGGLVLLVTEPAGHLLGQAAGWCAWWIVTVAEHAAALPAAAVGWTADPVSIGALAALCMLAALLLPQLLRHRLLSLLLAVALAVVVVRPTPAPGWPPEGWVLVACDVGQGDGLVLHAGRGSAVVVDTGPDPGRMDRCLDRLGVTTVPVVVLTHFHADHVGGLAGVLEGRSVGRIEVSDLREPEDGAAAVAAVAAGAGVPVTVARFGEQGAAGWVSWQVVGPSRHVSAGAEGSDANNASVVLVADVRGVRFLLPGDAEPEAQELLARTVGRLRVDVLKVPHHGSRYQDPALLTGLGARLALISVGADNDYGHPSPATVTLLRRAGMLVERTDRAGDVAVVLHDGSLRVRTAR